MAMDSVSLPVVSATAPPPPRTSSAAKTGTTTASSPVRGSRTPVEGGRPAGPQGSGESRNFDDVLSDVHAAKNDKTASGSTTSKTDDKDDPGERVEATRARLRRRLSSWLRCRWLSSTRHRRRRIVLLHAYERSAEHDHQHHHDEPAISDSVAADAVRPAVSPTPPAVLVPVAVASQPQPATAQNHDGAADGNVRADVAGKVAIGTEAEWETSRADRHRASRPGWRTIRNVPQAAVKAGESAATADRFAQHLDPSQDQATCQTRHSLERSFQPHVAVGSSSHDSLRTGRAGASVNAGRRRSVRIEGTGTCTCGCGPGTGTCSYGPGTGGCRGVGDYDSLSAAGRA